VTIGALSGKRRSQLGAESTSWRTRRINRRRATTQPTAFAIARLISSTSIVTGFLFDTPVLWFGFAADWPTPIVTAKSIVAR
jgi:hypothetical protein